MEKIIATHPLPFHADDLVACSLMQIYFASQGYKVSYLFSRDPATIAQADAAVDTGGVHDEQHLRFDHHQDKNATKAATGLVAGFLGKQQGFAWLNQLQSVFDQIDAADLGRASQHSQTSQILAQINPTWKELRHQSDMPKSLEESCLDTALEVIVEALNAGQRAAQSGQNAAEVFTSTIAGHPRMVERRQKILLDRLEGQELFLQESLKTQDNIVRTEQGIEFAELFSRPSLDKLDAQTRQALESIDYVVLHGPRGASAVAVPDPDNPMQQKHPFPETWRGKRGGQLLLAVSESTGLELPLLSDQAAEYYCHHSGFFLTMPDPTTFSSALAFCAQQTQKPRPETDEVDVAM
jgi:uncharacterized UPF0160 family protein